MHRDIARVCMQSKLHGPTQRAGRVDRAGKEVLTSYFAFVNIAIVQIRITV